MTSAKATQESSFEPKIIGREKRMLDAMVLIYCKANNCYGSAPCVKCTKLGVYAKSRLEHCRFQEKKPVCGRYDLTCYDLQNKDYAEEVFTYAGPRMMFEHPLLGIKHFQDAFRNNVQLNKQA